MGKVVGIVLAVIGLLSEMIPLTVIGVVVFVVSLMGKGSKSGVQPQKTAPTPPPPPPPPAAAPQPKPASEWGSPDIGGRRDFQGAPECGAEHCRECAREKSCTHNPANFLDAFL